jgi:LDH2 family malate/lactate/ureidoglycolate dehydrogenase
MLRLLRVGRCHSANRNRAHNKKIRWAPNGPDASAWEPVRGQMSQLVKVIQATPRRPGVEEIRIPSQRAVRERRRAEGILVDGAVIAARKAL